MTSLSDHVSSYNTSVGSPVLWDKETFLRRLSDFLQVVAENEEVHIPLKRLRYQMEQDSLYQDAVQRWDRMKGTERFDTWKELLSTSLQAAREILPLCVQCGDCCREGSPTLHIDDLALLRNETISWNRIVTLRQGEPVRSPFEDRLLFLLEERIKVQEKGNSRECVFSGQ